MVYLFPLLGNRTGFASCVFARVSLVVWEHGEKCYYVQIAWMAATPN